MNDTERTIGVDRTIADLLRAFASKRSPARITNDDVRMLYEAADTIESRQAALEKVLLAYEDESLNGPQAEDAMARAARDGLAYGR